MMAQKIIGNKYFEILMIIVIIADSVLLVMSSNEDITISLVLQFFSLFYGLEICLRLVAKGLRFFVEIWNLVDFIVVFLLVISRTLLRSTSNSFYSLMAPLIMMRLVKINGFKKILMKVFSSLTLLLETIIVFVYFSIIFAISGNLLFYGLFKNRCMEVSTGKFKTEEDDFCGNYPCPQGYICSKLLSNPGEGVTSFDNILSSLLLVLNTKIS
jgi:hypothetical protein